ncbi:MAG: hypothetical protein ACLTSZ_03865 [Lachnospiraceae bacterium]
MKADGTRATGWVKVNGGRYYLDKKGVRKYGWLTVGKKKYLLGTKTGKACTGWTNIAVKFIISAHRPDRCEKHGLPLVITNIIRRATGYARPAGRRSRKMVLF